MKDRKERRISFRPLFSGIELMFDFKGSVSARQIEHQRAISRARSARLAEMLDHTAAENIAGYWRNVGDYMRAAMAAVK